MSPNKAWPLFLLASKTFTDAIVCIESKVKYTGNLVFHRGNMAEYEDRALQRLSALQNELRYLESKNAIIVYLQLILNMLRI